VAALLWGYNPTLTIAQIKNAILNTGDAIVALSGKTVTGKRLNAYSALQSVSPAKAITAFNFSDPVVTGVIDEGAHTVQLNIPATPTTEFVTSIAITGTSINPASGVLQDFSDSVNYTVTAADGSTQVYSVTVSQILDTSILTATLTEEIGAQHSVPVYVLTSTDYAPEW